MLARELVALRAQPRDDALAVDQRLRAAERDEADLWRGAIRFRVGIMHGEGLAAIDGKIKERLAISPIYSAMLPLPRKTSSFPSLLFVYALADERRQHR